MQNRIDELREKRILLLYQCSESKTQFVKQRIYKEIKAINIELYKETQNPIYL